ncbi:MAG: hypothetical protein WDZ49_07615 [Litorilinea sp.]
MPSRPIAPFTPFLGVLFFVGIAALLRLWALDQTPPGFHFDESFEGLEAWRILTQPDYRPLFLRGNFGVPVAFAYLTAGMFWLFQQLGLETGPLAMRTVAASVGIVSVPVLMGVARELGHYGLVPRRAWLPVALASGGTLAGLRWHIHFSRMGIEPILGPLLWAASLWLLLVAWRTMPARPWRAYAAFAGSGVLAAAALYTYQAVWILPLILAGAALIALLAARATDTRAPSPAPLRPRLTGLLVAGGIALLLVLPLLLLFSREPALLTTRPTQVIAGEGNDRTIWENTVASLGMFLPFGTGDLDPRRNIPGEPALNWIWGSAFLLGAYTGIRRIRQPAWAILWLSWLGLLLPGGVTEYAPHYHRILAAAGPTAVIIGVGFWQAGHLAQRVARQTMQRAIPTRWAWAALFALILAASSADAHAYFVRWASRADLYYAFDEGFWEIGQWAAQQSAMTTFISPRGAEHTTLAFALRNQQASAAPIAYDGRHAFPLINAAGIPADAPDSLYIVVEHEDFRSPLLMPQVFPDATLAQQFTDRDGQVYATAWRRPAAMPSSRVPTYSHAALLADSIHLLGYDLLPATPAPGAIAYVQLHWQTEQAPTRDWTAYLHLLPPTDAPDPATIVAQHDAQPGQGTLPTARWRAGWAILDEHQLQLPPDLAPGDYRLRVGLYPSNDPASPLPPVDLGILTIGESE